MEFGLEGNNLGTNWMGEIKFKQEIRADSADESGGGKKKNKAWGNKNQGTSVEGSFWNGKLKRQYMYSRFHIPTSGEGKGIATIYQIAGGWEKKRVGFSRIFRWGSRRRKNTMATVASKKVKFCLLTEERDRACKRTRGHLVESG